MRRFLSSAAVILVLATAGCASAGHLAEYDFSDRAVAVVTDTPPRPEILSGADVDLTGEDLAGALIRIGTGVVKEHQASRARPRLDSAAMAIDVGGRMADRVLEQGARQLRARPVESVRDSDFEIEVRVMRYGIEADDWDAQAHFFVEAEVQLLERATGRRIWKTGVQESEPVTRGVVGGGAELNDVLTATALASLSRSEMEGALGYLADYCADRVVEKLRRGLEKARG